MPGSCHSHLIPYLRLHPADTRNMNLTTFKRFLKPLTVNISGSSFTDVAGDSHTHYGSGDIVVYKNIPNIHPSQAGNQQRSYCYKVGFRTLIMNTRLPLANNRGSCFNGCRLQFPGARPSSSMPSWNEEGSIGGDRKMGQGW